MPKKEPDGKDKELNVVYQNVKDHILGTKIDNLIEVFHIFKRNSPEGLIGERELRRVLTEYLQNASDFHVSSIISSLRIAKKADHSNLFRRFKIDEVIIELKAMKDAGTKLKSSTQKRKDDYV